LFISRDNSGVSGCFIARDSRFHFHRGGGSGLSKSLAASEKGFELRV
jgi:hypothetical protein